MEEKDIFKAEESGQVEEQLMLDLPTDIDGEVASFDQQVPQVKSAPPIEVVAQDIDKDIQTVSADEQKNIDEAQNKAKEKVRE